MARKIALVRTPPSNLEDMVRLLEEVGGNLERFVAYFGTSERNSEQILFDLYLQLDRSEHVELNKRWKFALRLSSTIRMDLLRCKAFKTAEEYQNKSASSSAPDVAFFRVLLNEPLLEASERIKSRYRLPVPVASYEKGTDDMTELEDTFTEAEGA